MKTALITGGTGFIGSHACVALSQSGHQLVILDNLCDSCADVIDRLATLCSKRLDTWRRQGGVALRYLQGDEKHEQG